MCGLGKRDGKDLAPPPPKKILTFFLASPPLPSYNNLKNKVFPLRERKKAHFKLPCKWKVASLDDFAVFPGSPQGYFSRIEEQFPEAIFLIEGRQKALPN